MKTNVVNHAAWPCPRPCHSSARARVGGCACMKGRKGQVFHASFSIDWKKKSRADLVQGAKDILVLSEAYVFQGLGSIFRYIIRKFSLFVTLKCIFDKFLGTYINGISIKVSRRHSTSSICISILDTFERHLPQPCIFLFLTQGRDLNHRRCLLHRRFVYPDGRHIPSSCRECWRAIVDKFAPWMAIRPLSEGVLKLGGMYTQSCL